MTAIQHPALPNHAVPHHARPHGATRRQATRSDAVPARFTRRVEAAVGVLGAVVVTALPAAWALMVLIDLAGGSASYRAVLPLGLVVGLVPLAVGAAMGRTQGARPDVRVVVGTGVDPVTFRFSGGRSAN